MKVFISGPMSGHPDDNFPLFDTVAVFLTRSGHIAVNPAQIVRDEMGNQRNLSRHVYMRHLLPKMADCDAICLLPDYKDSWGASAEIAAALAFGMDFYEWRPAKQFIEGIRIPERVTVHHPSVFGPRMP